MLVGRGKYFFFIDGATCKVPRLLSTAPYLCSFKILITLPGSQDMHESRRGTSWEEKGDQWGEGVTRD